MDSMGITSYYERLPRGKKDSFIRDAADALERSTSTIRAKLSSNRWTRLELKELSNLINGGV